MKTVYKVSELPHLFVHQKVEYARDTNTTYEIRNNKFFFRNELVAQIWNNTIYTCGFDNRSCYNNGLRNYDITKAAENVLSVINVPVSFRDLSIDSNRQLLANDITLYYANILASKYASLHYMIYGNAKKARETYGDIDGYKKLLQVLNLKPDNDILDRTIKCSAKIYHGWCRHDYIIHNAPDKTVKWLLKDKFLNTKETAIYEDKSFYSKYIYGSGISFKESRKRFDTKEKQDKYIAGKEARDYAERKAQEEKLKTENKEAYDKAIKQLYDWAEGRSNIISSRYLFGIRNAFKPHNRNLCIELPVVLRIIGGLRCKDENKEIVCDSDTKYIVETSLGVTFSLFDAYKLYQLYKICKAKEKIWKANGNQFNIGQYKLNMIGKRDNKWFIVAGCHEVFEDEIERFIKFNKLNW